MHENGECLGTVTFDQDGWSNNVCAECGWLAMKAEEARPNIIRYAVENGLFMKL